jgi:uncharacterized protein YjbJ (UPF0337 family)
MNKDELKGKGEKIAGEVKQTVGAATGDKAKEAEGFGDRFRGAVREKVGEAKEKIEQTKEKIAEKKRDTARDVEESDDD